MDQSSGRLLEIRDVAVKDHPAFFCVPVFEPPGVLCGTREAGKCDSWSFVSNPDAISGLPVGTKGGVVEFHAMTYARMVAKIAHAFAAAERALGEEFAPMLPPFILGKTEFEADFLVGCLEKNKPAEPDVLHRVHLEYASFGDGGLRWLVANVRLFAKFGAPQYHVVVGSPVIGRVAQPSAPGGTNAGADRPPDRSEFRENRQNGLP